MGMIQKTNQKITIIQEIVTITKRDQKNRKELSVDVSNVARKVTKRTTVQQRMRQLMTEKLIINNLENMIKRLSKKNERNIEVNGNPQMKENLKIILKQQILLHQRSMYLVVLPQRLHTNPRNMIGRKTMKNSEMIKKRLSLKNRKNIKKIRTKFKKLQ